MGRGLEGECSWIWDTCALCFQCTVYCWTQNSLVLQCVVLLGLLSGLVAVVKKSRGRDQQDMYD